jgi:hypothetical protein
MHPLAFDELNMPFNSQDLLTILDTSTSARPLHFLLLFILSLRSIARPTSIRSDLRAPSSVALFVSLHDMLLHSQGLIMRLLSFWNTPWEGRDDDVEGTVVEEGAGVSRGRVSAVSYGIEKVSAQWSRMLVGF